MKALLSKSVRAIGKFFSEALILASTNPQYEKKDAKIRASDKDLPVPRH